MVNTVKGLKFAYLNIVVNDELTLQIHDKSIFFCSLQLSRLKYQVNDLVKDF